MWESSIFQFPETISSWKKYVQLKYDNLTHRVKTNNILILLIFEFARFCCRSSCLVPTDKDLDRGEKRWKKEGRRRAHELQFIRAIVRRDYSSLVILHACFLFMPMQRRESCDNNFSLYEIDRAWHHCTREKC